MFSELLNRIRSSYAQHYEILVALLAGIIVFRKVGTIAIIVFFLFNLLFYKKLRFSKEKWLPIFLISIPFLLDVIFIWNNVEISEGFKHMEKRVSLLLLPIFLIGQSFKFNLLKILKIYSVVFISVLNILFIRFLIIEPELVSKYLNGIHLWEMGYSFANSTGVHAPALNMHIALLVVSTAYIITGNILKSSWKKITLWSMILIDALGILLLINTRLAMVNAIIGIFIVIAFQLFKKVSLKKLITISTVTVLLLTVMFLAFAKAFPYVKEKFTRVTFAHMDKVGELDDFESPENEVFSSFVTRVSIWKTAWERAQEDIWVGVGAADGKDVLNKAYIDTNQQFLAKYKFPTHNQYLDFLLKFGILGLIGVLVYIFNILYLGWKMKHSLVLFFFILFFTSNLTDDFLIRYDGITFSALWISIFATIYLNSKQRIYSPNH